MNSEKIGNIIGVIFAWMIIIGILAITGLGVYHFPDILKWFINLLKPFKSLDAVIIVAIIGAVTTFVANLLSKRSDHKFELRKYLAGKRQESYEDFLKIFFDILEADGQEIDDIPSRLNLFKQTLLLYGSKRTYKSFVKYWKAITDSEVASEVQIDLMEKVVSEMRKDAGAGGVRKNLISNILINNSKKD